jgi:hypothetical protein
VTEVSDPTPSVAAEPVDIYVGKDLGWRAVDTGPEAVERYIDVTGDANDWYRGASPLGGPLLPATFLHFQGFNHNPGWFPATIHGTLFARLRWQWCRPLLVGEAVRSHAWVSEIQLRGERWHVTCDTDVYGAADDLALRTRTTQTFLVDEGYRGPVRSKATGPRRARPEPEADAGDSEPMGELRRFVTTDRCVRFFGGTRNYHTDADESAKMGFDDIVVGGPMSVCYLGEMLTGQLGARLLSGSDLDIRFVDILWPDNEITIAARRATEPVAELGRQRVPFTVDIRDPQGRVTVVAKGSHVAPADQP